jgi:hypothetical protein
MRGGDSDVHDPLLWFVLGLIGLVVLWAFWQFLSLPGSIDWRAKRQLRRAHARRLDAATAALVAEARSALAFGAWERLPEGETILRQERWSDRELLAALESLYQTLEARDRAQGRPGAPGSSVFDFYDSGLADICEALKQRLGAVRSR